MPTVSVTVNFNLVIWKKMAKFKFTMSKLNSGFIDFF